MSSFLVIKGKAGLGNRMLCAVTGLLYSRLAGRQPVVDWSDFTYSNDGSNSFPLLFDCQETLAALPNLDAVSVSPEVWRGRLDKSANDLLDEFDKDKHSSPTIWRKYSVDLTRLESEANVAVFWSFTQQLRSLRRHFTGAFKSYASQSDEAILTSILRKDMLLHPSIQAKVDEFRSTHFSGDVIGVHVRYMDRRTSLADFLKHIDRLIQKRPAATVFLATDNKVAEDTIRNRYERVVTTPKWFPEGGVSMHQNPQCPDRLRNAVEALVDMYLLAECNYLIFPGSSTFSLISSFLTAIPRQNIVDIERYNLRIRAKKAIRSWIQ